MLRRFSLGFASIAAVVAIAACSSAAVNPVGIGPSFPPASLYASDSSQNSINIYQQAVSGSGPINNLSASANLFGPEYLAFDPSGDLYVSAYDQSSGLGAIVELKALATGNVTAYGETNYVSHPRGVGIFTIPGQADPALVVADLNPSASPGSTSEIVIFDSVVLGGPYEIIAGPATLLNVPSGVAADSKNIYVTNMQGASVEGFAEPTSLPTATPTPAATATPTTTPSPTTSPTTTPSPAVVFDQAPSFVIKGGATGLITPVGIALDSTGNIYVVDRGSSTVAPAILVFGANPSGTVTSAPIRKISGPTTGLNSPSDIKVDTAGHIFVSDTCGAVPLYCAATLSPGANVINEYAAGATGSLPPSATYTSPGAVVGIALTP